MMERRTQEGLPLAGGGCRAASGTAWTSGPELTGTEVLGWAVLGGVHPRAKAAGGKVQGVLEAGETVSGKTADTI